MENRIIVLECDQYVKMLAKDFDAALRAPER
jgi:hypothetical protein